jgi:two-component system nitrogen regulation sensor histidine kinase NtrY
MLDVAGYIPMGRHVREYLTDDDFRPVIESLRKLFSSSVPFELRIDKTMAVGSRSYSFRGRPMFGRYGFTAGFLLLVDDVTETIAQERLVNWASVAHHIAHEMKTPLGTVRVTAEMLRDRLGSNGGDHDELRATTRIIRQSERLRSIVDDLLTVARTESLRKIGADLGLLLPSLTSDYLEYLPPGVELKLTIEGDDFHCHIDVAQVTVALRNLLDNARHAIGGHAGGRIDLAMRSDDSMITITVADNGVGMGPETLAKLFQPFYTEREGGSGIGTIIIKRVIEGHGGTIDVSSKVGVGTVFTVTLPRG